MVELTACMLVRDEDRFVWYAVNSVLPYVSRFIIFDTGSSDRTADIIKSVKSPKILFREKGPVSPREMTQMRQEQSSLVKKGWMWLVDGDEVYPEKTAGKVLGVIKSRPRLGGIIIHRYDLLGDIYHFQDESVGTYDQFGKKGHYVLRLINKDVFTGLEVLGDYPDEYFAEKGISIKETGPGNFAFVEERIFHAMYLRRSSRGGNLPSVLNRSKYKIELGHKLDRRLLPEVYSSPRPSSVPDVTGKRGLIYFIIALFVTPVKMFKRRILQLFE